MKKICFLLAICIACFVIPAHSQTRETDPGWQWGRFTNTLHAVRSEKILTDFENNIVSFFYYKSHITIEDTSFTHPELSQEYSIAIVKRNSNGDFIKAADMFSVPGGMLFNTDIAVDNESNVFLYGTFDDTIFINSTMVILKNPGVDVYLIKLDNNLEFQWSKIISSKYQDDSEGIIFSADNGLYISAVHYNSLDTSHFFVNYFDQDSADVSKGLNSILKLDADGNIIWRAELRDNYEGYAKIIAAVSGEDGNIYVSGRANNDIFIQGDTVNYPGNPDYSTISFVIQFDQEGNHHNAFFTPYPQLNYFYPELKIDRNGNYCLATQVRETLAFGSDTIKLTNDSAFALIGKFDPSFNPIWYHGIKTTGTTAINFQLKMIGDSMAFAFHGVGRFYFMGQEYVLNALGQVLTGLFSPQGELVNLQMTDASFGADLYNFHSDNCSNFIIDGILRGTTHFNDDTLNAGYDDIHFIAKNAMIIPASLALPSDTAGCGPIMLSAPEGYLYYQWNGVLSDQNIYQVESSGTVDLKAANEDGCWSEASTNVTIYDPFQLQLGNDTTILLTDTLIIAVPENYESYLWSTGNTTAGLTLPASQLQIGTNKIWLEVANGPCYGSDTILVTVIDNSSVKENLPGLFILQPNPVRTKFSVINKTRGKIDYIRIYDLNGILMMDLEYRDNIRVDVSTFQKGIYIVDIETDTGSFQRKLIVF